MVVKTYMDMDQDSEEEKQQYLDLALHLASEFFLRNPNKDVRLLVACCLADIFRIYAPEAPYTSHDKLKVSRGGLGEPSQETSEECSPNCHALEHQNPMGIHAVIARLAANYSQGSPLAASGNSRSGWFGVCGNKLLT